MKQKLEKIIKEALNGFFTVNIASKIAPPIAERIMRSGIIPREGIKNE